MNINCSSEATIPPANLTWYINQQPVGIYSFTHFTKYILYMTHTDPAMTYIDMAFTNMTHTDMTHTYI